MLPPRRRAPQNERRMLTLRLDETSEDPHSARGLHLYWRRKGEHVWTTPTVQEVVAGDEHRSGCIHMFSLFAQHRMAAGLENSADRSPITSSHSKRSAPLGSCDPRSTGVSSSLSYPLHHPPLLSLRRGWRSRGSRRVDLVTRHHCLGDPRGFVGERHRGDLYRLAGEQLGCPQLPSRILARHAHHRRGADDRKTTQVAVTLLTDAAQTGTWSRPVRRPHSPRP